MALSWDTILLRKELIDLELKVLEHTNYWQMFLQKIDAVLKKTLDKDIIIFGSNPGGEFVRWFYEHVYSKQVMAVVDRWNLDNHYQVHHLMSLYYLWTDNAVIINTLPDGIGPKEEFGAIGEVWERTAWKEEQIIPLHKEIFFKGVASQDRYITFYDWMEEEYSLDVLTSVRRADIKSKGGHGYYPTDFRMILDAADDEILDKDSGIMDFGCGKGAAMIALRNCGFKKVAGIEYTDSIYNVMCDNLEKLGYCVQRCTDKTVHDRDLDDDQFYCYLGDALELNEELDNYGNFYFFNPFSYELTKKVIGNILDSLKRKPRKMAIFYAEPMCHNILMQSGEFKLVKKIDKSLGGVTYSAYIYKT